ncbi:MAG: transporter [Thermoanaerobaculia bacterium]
MRFSCFLILLLALPLHAQQSSIVADRPGLADGSTTVGSHTFQLETGVTHEDDDGSLLTLPTLLRLGLASDFELRIESAVLGFTSGDEEWAPVALGFKWRVRDDEAFPLSLLVSVQPPSGGGSLGARELETSVRIVSDLDLGGGFSLTPNVGLSLVEGGDPVAVFAASVEREAGNAVPFLDFEVSAGDGETSAIVDGGVAWIVNRQTQLDISGGVRVSGTAYPDHFIAAGISRRF